MKHTRQLIARQVEFDGCKEVVWHNGSRRWQPALLPPWPRRPSCLAARTTVGCISSRRGPDVNRQRRRKYFLLRCSGAGSSVGGGSTAASSAASSVPAMAGLRPARSYSNFGEQR